MIDDDQAIRESTGALIRSWGSTAITARHADEARQAFATAGRLPDLVISDQQLPGGDLGLPFIARTRQEAGWPVPSILVTGDTSAELLRAAKDMDVPVLHKPVTGLRLRSMASSLLAQVQPRGGSRPGPARQVIAAAGPIPAHWP